MEDKEGGLLVGKGVTITGSINATGAVHVYGNVNGEIIAHEICVGVTGKVNGDVKVDAADIHGEIVNSLDVRKTLIIRASGKVSGLIRYDSMEIEQGGSVEGSIEKMSAKNDFGILPAIITSETATKND